MSVRVLEVLATLKRAGAENMAVALACGLERTRFEPAVVSLYDAFPQGLEPVLDGCGVRTWHLSKRPGFDIRIYGRLRSVVRDFQPDIVHTHSYVMRYTLPLRVRGMVHTVHNIAEKEVDFAGRLVHRIAFRRGVRAVAIADEVARSFRRVYGAPPSAVIPNGIHTGRFYRPEVRDQWRRANGFTASDVLIVSVARLAPQKNPSGLVEAFRRASVNAKLLLIGEGTLPDVPPGVQLLGVRGDVPDALAAADIFALASHWEGHPLSVIEAMAAGLPVVVTAVGGVPEIVGDAGVVVPGADMQAFAAALRKLVDDAEYRRALGEAARVRAAMFDVRGMVTAYERLFEAVAHE